MIEHIPATSQWSILLITIVLTAFLLSVVVLLQILSSFTSAYISAPRQITTLLDVVDSSVQENESHDAQISHVRRLDDRMRLGKILKEIQKEGDDLRENLDRLLLSDDDHRLKTKARLLWFVRRRDLEDKVRRLDMLRTRFQVLYLGIVNAGQIDKADKKRRSSSGGDSKDPEKLTIAERLHDDLTARPHPSRALTEAIKNRPPLRRLTTQAIGHNATVEGGHRTGWAGVVRELQLSPRMHKRHASIETALARSSESSPGGPSGR